MGIKWDIILQDGFFALSKTLILLSICGLWTLLVFLALSLLSISNYGLANKKNIACIGAFTFGLLALVAGMITGASRTAAVSDVMPAALSFIGGVALYLLNKPGINVALTSTSVISFSAMLIAGIALGSYERVRAEYLIEVGKYDVPRLIAEAEVEFVVNAYRTSKGLKERNFNAADGAEGVVQDN